MKIFYYTATGNSLSVAKELSDNIISMPRELDVKKTVYKDDAIGFIFPCYGGSMPTIVENFINKHSFIAKYVFAIITYGNMVGGAESQFTYFANSNNLDVDYINKVKMLDTSLKYYDMDKQLEKLEKRGVVEQIQSIRDDIYNRKARRKNNIILRKLSDYGYKSYRNEIGDCDKLFSVEEHCTKCGVCQMVCPVNNISVKESVEFHGGCLRCYACTHNCPSNAIRFEGEKSKTRFRNKDISLKEIIAANNN